MNLEDREISIRNGMGTDGEVGTVWHSNVLRDRLVTDDELDRGERRVSPNKRYILELGTDKELILYDMNIPNGGEVWRTNTQAALPNAELRMQSDGNVVLYSKRNASDYPEALWATGTKKPGSALLVQYDGNVVVYGPDGKPAWSRLTGRIG